MAEGLKPGAGEKMELFLDLLVDNELPEEDRERVLRSMDGAPDRWRELAIRFLQQQTEKSSVKQIMRDQYIAEAHRANVRRMGRRMAWRRQWKVAAGVLLPLVAAGYLAVNVANRHGDAPRTQELVTVAGRLPAVIDGGRREINFQVGSEQQTPIDLADFSSPRTPGDGLADNGNSPRGDSTRHVIFMPADPQHGIAVPVSEVTLKKDVFY